MLSCTLQEYKDSYETKLSAYLNKHGDNTPSSFLEIEIKSYNDYDTILNKLKAAYSKKALKETFIKNKLLRKLKKINISSYNGIISQEIKHGESSNTKSTFVIIDIEKLTNYITSSNQILKFFNKEYRFSNNSNKLYKPVDLIGELPFLTTKRQSAVPGKEIVVNAGANVKPKKSVNPHPQVFLNTEAYELFQKLFEAFKISYNKLADFSFIYRIMHKDGFILDSFKPQMFINWLNKDPFNISLDKLKTLDNCSTLNKIQTYNIIKEALQIK